MLKLTENFCILETKNTSLWLKTGEGAPKLLYFGEKIAGPEGAEFAPVPAAPLFLQPCDPSPVGETVRACLADGSVLPDCSCRDVSVAGPEVEVVLVAAGPLVVEPILPHVGLLNFFRAVVERV